MASVILFIGGYALVERPAVLDDQVARRCHATAAREGLPGIRRRCGRCHGAYP